MAIDILKSLANDIKAVGDETRARPQVEVTPEAPIAKGLTAGVVHSLRKQAFAAGAAHEDLAVGVRRERAPGEPPVVPVRRISTPLQTSPAQPIAKSCNTCQTVHKSDVTCPRCEFNRRSSEAGPTRFRG